MHTHLAFSSLPLLVGEGISFETRSCVLHAGYRYRCRSASTRAGGRAQEQRKMTHERGRKKVFIKSVCYLHGGEIRSLPSSPSSRLVSSLHSCCLGSKAACASILVEGGRVRWIEKKDRLDGKAPRV
ncbi:hypothetical protein B0H14DRAFT_557301 [Mycena olivaceomarginata]|nr:hypothetical protein B0H14DRAFT_557301 [Mycena olivaceomarginata]